MTWSNYSPRSKPTPNSVLLPDDGSKMTKGRLLMRARRATNATRFKQRLRRDESVRLSGEEALNRRAAGKALR